jgi:hypothetical protein
MHDEPHTPISTPQSSAPETAPTGREARWTWGRRFGVLALWAFAGIMAGLVLVALTRPGATLPSERLAMADVAVAGGEMSAVTVNMGGNDDILVILDQRTDYLLVYGVFNQRVVEFRSRESLPELFASVRPANDPRSTPGQPGVGVPGGGTFPPGSR